MCVTFITCFGAVEACEMAGGESDCCFLGLWAATSPEPCCCWFLGESDASTRTIIAILKSLVAPFVSNEGHCNPMCINCSSEELLCVYYKN